MDRVTGSPLPDFLNLVDNAIAYRNEMPVDVASTAKMITVTIGEPLPARAWG